MNVQVQTWRKNPVTDLELIHLALELGTTNGAGDPFAALNRIREALEKIAAMDEPQNAGVYVAAEIATEAITHRSR